jgi:2-succinyl-5-enolpyruvyl-6-hydroxy-3-cyclohexene-1-carboxylate synthase
MAELSITVAATFCATLVDEWVRCGVTDAVVAPGSRSTPMALALSSDDRIRVHVHHDERSAGFLALGLGLATGRPALVLTTSGTAAVELHPAVVEAHHARVPLICLTADRPPELRDVGAPQTIDQTRLYGTATRWFADHGVPDVAVSASWRSLAGRAVMEATDGLPGPVQVNLPFRDPLVGRPDDLPPGRAGGMPWHRTAPVERSAPLMEGLIGRRGVIVAGGCGGGRSLDADAVHDLARALAWPVIADPRSGCRVPEGATVSHADALLRHADFAGRHRPEVVVHIGDPPASKVVSQWIAASDALQVVLSADGAIVDPERRAAHVVVADPDETARRWASDVRAAGSTIDDDWIESWAAADACTATAITTTLAHHPEPTEPAVARDLLAALPDRSALVVSSSMPVRDVEWYGGARRGVRVLSNRGANGIDGVVSTATGVALTGVPTAVLIGDVALLHDTNGLLGLTSRDIDLVIVVVDNDGGGIFSFLPQATALDHDRFEQLFGTPHGVDLDVLAGAHGIVAERVELQSDLGPAVRRCHAAGGVHLLLATTHREANVAVHDEIHDAVARALSN